MSRESTEHFITFLALIGAGTVFYWITSASWTTLLIVGGIACLFFLIRARANEQRWLEHRKAEDAEFRKKFFEDHDRRH